MVEASRTPWKHKKTHALDPSSAEHSNSQLHENLADPVVEPKKSKRMYGTSNTCHQCDSGRVVRCLGCEPYKRRYCMKCIERWYPNLSEKDFEMKCPFCRNICNCKDCLRTVKITKKDECSVSKDDKMKCSLRIVHFLLPWLKEFYEEQMLEKSVEASVQGVDVCKVEVPQANNPDNMRIYCDNCRTSIVDFHRSCRNCSYELCLRCCLELRQGRDGVNEALSLSEVGGKDGFRQNSTQWMANSDKSIPCPPTVFDCCGNSCLELKYLFQESFISGLLEKANSVVNGAAAPIWEESKCSCFSESGVITDGRYGWD